MNFTRESTRIFANKDEIQNVGETGQDKLENPLNNEDPNTQPASAPAEIAQPQPVELPPWKVDAVLFGIVVGFAALIYLACRIGYDQGLRMPGEVLLGPLVMAILSIFFSILELCLCSRIVNDGFHGIISWMVFPALLVAPLMLGSYYNWAFNYGESVGCGKLSRDSGELRVFVKAFAAYRAECGSYPASLKELVSSKAWLVVGGRTSLQNQDFRIPSSAFGDRLPLRYALVNPASSDAGPAGLVWFSGPDRKYDLQDGPELQAALRTIKSGSPAPWLVERTYDPSNGVSGGDMIRFFPEHDR
jgi:hypothetical protein